MRSGSGLQALAEQEEREAAGDRVGPGEMNAEGAPPAPVSRFAANPAAQTAAVDLFLNTVSRNTPTISRLLSAGGRGPLAAPLSARF